MEQEHDNKAPAAGRFVLLGALLLLCASAGAAFGGVFRGALPAAKLAAVAAGAVLLAFVLERRHTFVATAISVLGLAVVAGIIVFPETTWFGVPTATTFRSFLDAFARVGSVADAHAAPTAAFDPLLLAAVTAAWTATYSAHVLAVRARSPFLALLPPGTLMAFTSLVVPGGPRRFYVGVFLLAAFGVLYGDGLRRISQWGPLTVWHGSGRRRARVASTRGARRLALVCLAVAFFIPGILPGFRSQGLVDVHAKTQRTLVGIDPIVDIRPTLARNPATELFTVRSDRPAYWRSLSLDRFDGRRWSSSDPEAKSAIEVRDGVVPNGTRAAGTVVVRQQIRLDKLNELWLPAAFDPLAIAAPGKRIRFDPTSGALVAPDGTRPGFTYDVTSREPVPSPDALDSLPLASDATSAPFKVLPANTPEGIYAIARKLTAGFDTPYRKVLAIQSYLRTFRYDEHAAPGHGLNDILYFLNTSRAGYCEQFAGTMAVLLRALGIPARPVIGFTPGTFDATADVYRVSTKHLHAWVEVRFPGVGWLPFEPTPTRSNPVATYTAPEPSFRRSDGRAAPRTCVVSPTGIRFAVELGPGVCPAKRAKARSGSSQRPKRRVTKDPDTGAGQPGVRDRRASSPSRWPGVILIVAMGLAALLAVAVPLTKALRRVLRMRRARTPRERVVAAYSLMTARAADLGVGPKEQETVHEYAGRLKATVPFSNGHLDRLAQLVATAAYGSSGVGGTSAEEAAVLARRVTKEIAASRDLSTRLFGFFRLRDGSSV
ncbi:MAG TPA: DUF3488 and transglutaminase-like domain-containing protein [Actinomycetota bacterium]